VRLAWTLPLLLAACTSGARPPAATPRASTSGAARPAPVALTAWPARGVLASDAEAKAYLAEWWSSRGAVVGESSRLLYLGLDGHSPVAVFTRTAPGRDPQLVLGRQPTAADCVVTCYYFCVVPLPAPGTPVTWYVPYHERQLFVLAPPGAPEVKVTSGGTTTRVALTGGFGSAAATDPFTLTVDRTAVPAPTVRHADEKVDCAAF
jgi:hypothetical protein